MDCAEVRGESPAEEQLECLLILEEGDEPEEFANNTARGRGILKVRKAQEDEDEGGVKENTDTTAKVEESQSGHEGTDLIKENLEKCDGQQEEALENEGGEVKQKIETTENSSDGTQEDPEAKTAQTGGGPATMEKAEGDKSEVSLRDTDRVDKEKEPVTLRPKDFLRPEDALRKGHGSSPDFPDTLYELLCTLQEGRRLNDQRCSFRLKGRRRCYSEPSTPRHSLKVTFSSMTSLQKEEFFDFLATSQGRRLDDQRAEFQSLSPVLSSPEPPLSSSPPTVNPTATSSSAAPQAKAKPRKGSCKLLEPSRPLPKPAPKEDLYNMILTSQAQGRLEDQRSAAPGPMDDEDFFSLLLKVQGGRMDEQRTELPVAFKY
ncbi:uncharacterized protein [Hoplias malabaricus]|uniref:uncharacterized protein n=1 Tax=Hoplias malabaricus TaxID=27720 RepID=UPI003461B05F